MKTTNKLFSEVPTTIFAIMTGLANEHNAINLGQGFPDTDGPEWIRNIAAKAILEGPNQYPPLNGVKELRQAVANSNKRFYNLDVDPEKEVLITSGATEALMNCCLSLLNQDDEAIVIEPFYDSYPEQIKAAGGIPVFVRLEAPKWELTEELLRPAFSNKTKLIMLNSPMNPVGKVFTLDELEIIAKLLIEFDAYAVCDEVYEHLLFDDIKHIPLISLNQMRDRCIRIGSAGKTFSFTGWKVGYVTASPNLIKGIAGAHQFVTYTTPPCLQLAIADGLNAGEDYYSDLIKQMDKGRKKLSQGLENIGFRTSHCDGTYFIAADFSSLNSTKSDVDFCEWLTKEVGVTAIPMSAFYSNSVSAAPKSLIRFCFAKQDHVLEEALDRMRAYFKP